MKLLKLKLNNRYRFYIVFFILLFLLFLQYAFLVSIPSLVFVALLVFSAFFGDKDELIAVEDDKELSLVMKEYEKTFA